MESRNTRIGYALFLVYLVLYGGFVLIAAFSPETMDQVFGGLNLAVIYGFGLIIAAVVLALIYGVMCGSGSQDESAKTNETEAG